MDTDRDGYISANELASAVRATGANPTEAEIQEMIRKVDANGEF